jgi:hypothetical protein
MAQFSNRSFLSKSKSLSVHPELQEKAWWPNQLTPTFLWALMMETQHKRAYFAIWYNDKASCMVRGNKLRVVLDNPILCNFHPCRQIHAKGNQLKVHSTLMY